MLTSFAPCQWHKWDILLAVFLELETDFLSSVGVKDVILLRFLDFLQHENSRAEVCVSQFFFSREERSKNSRALQRAEPSLLPHHRPWVRNPIREPRDLGRKSVQSRRRSRFVKCVKASGNSRTQEEIPQQTNTGGRSLLYTSTRRCILPSTVWTPETRTPHITAFQVLSQK